MGCEPIDMTLFRMARMYGWNCTKQEEKFISYVQRGCLWRWEDCEAAHTLLWEKYGRDYLGMHKDFRDVGAYDDGFWIDGAE